MNSFLDHRLIEKAIKGKKVFTTNQKDFDSAFKHIFNLLKDSASLYFNASYHTSLFLAITAIEETAKAHMGIFQYGHDGEELERKEDPLFSHRKKHQISLIDTVIMGSRIIEALGSARCNELLKIAHSGELSKIRERCLYFYTENDVFHMPSNLIDKKMSKDFLLLAIECLDDQLIGYTNYAMSANKEIDDLFKEVQSR